MDKEGNLKSRAGRRELRHQSKVIGVRKNPEEEEMQTQSIVDGTKSFGTLLQILTSKGVGKLGSQDKVRS